MRDNGHPEFEACIKEFSTMYQSYLTRSINQMVLENQLPHKTVNLVFKLVIVQNKLTIWGGVDFLKPFN